MAIAIAEGLVIVVGGLLAAAFFILAYKLFRTDKGEYARNRERMHTLTAGIMGEVTTIHDGTRDYRVGAGLAVDTKKNVWKEQGKLSDEAISSILR